MLAKHLSGVYRRTRAASLLEMQRAIKNRLRIGLAKKLFGEIVIARKSSSRSRTLATGLVTRSIFLDRAACTFAIMPYLDRDHSL